MYVPEKKVYNLEFADRPGLEVSARSATLGQLSHVSQLTVNLQEKDEEKRMEVFEFFAKKLIAWNIGHPEFEPNEGEITCPDCGLAEKAAVPPTVKGMLCLDLDLVMAVITGWVFAVGRVSLPKGMSLRNGGSDTLSEEVMRQLEVLQNPSTLPTPNFS